MNRGYDGQLSYPGVAFPPLQPAPPAPEKPGRPWPLGAVNRWMTIGAIAITLLAVLLAALAPRLVSGPPSTAGMTLAYQSSLTQNDSSGQMQWDENDNCQFTINGYVVSAPDPNFAVHCLLKGSSFQDFTLHVRVVQASEIALIGFLSSDRLAIFGSGRFLLYHIAPDTGQQTFLLPRTGISAGSAALHNTDLGVSTRANDITIQVRGLAYSFYANGQLLATYSADALENPGPISLGAAGGQQAEFSDIAIYTPG